MNIVTVGILIVAIALVYYYFFYSKDSNTQEAAPQTIPPTATPNPQMASVPIVPGV